MKAAHKLMELCGVKLQRLSHPLSLHVCVCVCVGGEV